MEMIEILESDRERIMNELGRSGSPEQAQSVLEKTFDRLLLQYNEECDEERVRDAARYILLTARTMVPMISASGETRVWSRSAGTDGSGSGFKMTVPAIACMAGGIVFIVGAVLGLAVSAGDGLSMSALLGSVPAVLLGGGLMFFSGWLSNSRGSSKGGDSKDRQVEIFVNPERIWTCLRAVVLSADKSLKEVREMAAYEKSKLTEYAGDALAPEEAELFAGILENAYSHRAEDPDDDSVQETISLVRYYLHRRQVEVVEYGGGKREWFELLPGMQQATLRPAFVKDGTLIRKGLAVAGQ